MGSNGETKDQHLTCDATRAGRILINIFCAYFKFQFAIKILRQKLWQNLSLKNGSQYTALGGGRSMLVRDWKIRTLSLFKSTTNNQISALTSIIVWNWIRSVKIIRLPSIVAYVISRNSTCLIVTVSGLCSAVGKHNPKAESKDFYKVKRGSF